MSQVPTWKVEYIVVPFTEIGNPEGINFMRDGKKSVWEI
jgi:hypothetical protein